VRHLTGITGGCPASLERHGDDDGGARPSEAKKMKSNRLIPCAPARFLLEGRGFLRFHRGEFLVGGGVGEAEEDEGGRSSRASSSRRRRRDGLGEFQRRAPANLPHCFTPRRGSGRIDRGGSHGEGGVAEEYGFVKIIRTKRYGGTMQ
jgi:hypothetical protein